MAENKLPDVKVFTRRILHEYTTVYMYNDMTRANIPTFMVAT